MGSDIFDDSLRGGNGICSHFLLLLDNGADSSIKKAAERLCVSLKDTRRDGQASGVFSGTRQSRWLSAGVITICYN
ncbi:MAG: hypothetical protein WA651_19610, partial [Candidatus Sulfotelmatobacter sp.]